MNNKSNGHHQNDLKEIGDFIVRVDLRIRLQRTAERILTGFALTCALRGLVDTAVLIELIQAVLT